MWLAISPTEFAKVSYKPPYKGEWGGITYPRDVAKFGKAAAQAEDSRVRIPSSRRFTHEPQPMAQRQKGLSWASNQRGRPHKAATPMSHASATTVPAEQRSTSAPA